MACYEVIQNLTDNLSLFPPDKLLDVLDYLMLTLPGIKIFALPNIVTIYEKNAEAIIEYVRTNYFDVKYAEQLTTSFIMWGCYLQYYGLSKGSENYLSIKSAEILNCAKKITLACTNYVGKDPAIRVFSLLYLSRSNKDNFEERKKCLSQVQELLLFTSPEIAILTLIVILSHMLIFDHVATKEEANIISMMVYTFEKNIEIFLNTDSSLKATLCAIKALNFHLNGSFEALYWAKQSLNMLKGEILIPHTGISLISSIMICAYYKENDAVELGFDTLDSPNLPLPLKKAAIKTKLLPRIKPKKSPKIIQEEEMDQQLESVSDIPERDWADDILQIDQFANELDLSKS